MREAAYITRTTRSNEVLPMRCLACSFDLSSHEHVPDARIAGLSVACEFQLCQSFVQVLYCLDDSPIRTLFTISPALNRHADSS